MKERTVACNCVTCTTARVKALGGPIRESTKDKEEALLNKICDEIEAECFCDASDYNREKMKERLLRHITS